MTRLRTKSRAISTGAKAEMLYRFSLCRTRYHYCVNSSTRNAERSITMTEEQLREVKPGDRLIIQAEVVRHDPRGRGVDLATVHPEDGHYIGGAFYAYQEAPAIIPESCSVYKRPYSICRSSGVHGICWSVKHASGLIVATFVEDLMPDAQKEAINLRDKMNNLFNSQKESSKLRDRIDNLFNYQKK